MKRFFVYFRTGNSATQLRSSIWPLTGFFWLWVTWSISNWKRYHMSHSLRLGTEKGQRKFWERHISMICLCSKYVKNCNIFGQILNIWLKLILKKNHFFFQCLALPKDPQSFGSQNLRCPFWVSQYYRRRRLWTSHIIQVISMIQSKEETLPV